MFFGALRFCVLSHIKMFFLCSCVLRVFLEKPVVVGVSLCVGWVCCCLFGCLSVVCLFVCVLYSVFFAL